jgi:hypothetical protein
MVIGTGIVGQLAADMFKQVFIKLVWKVAWRAEVVNYFLKIFQSFSFFLEFKYPDWLIREFSPGAAVVFRLSFGLVCRVSSA